MPRIPLPGRRRRQRGQKEASDAAPQRPIRRASSPGALRRERKAILKAREELLRDLGGLAMEMYRREQFREDLLSEHARDIANLEARLHELDSMLAATAAGRPADAGFCPSCGKAAEPPANGDGEREADATVIRPAKVGAEEGNPKPDRWEE